jgi:peptide deformylase
MAYRRRIVLDPEPVLRKVAKKVTNLELRMPLTQQLIDDMVETMREAPGIGLAAPQVGVSKRIFVAEVSDEDDADEDRKLYVFVNPVLTDFEGEETATEGCLSIPGRIGDVTRAATCTITGWDRSGKKVRVEAKGLLARCIQHEVDHLDGILITDKAANMRDAIAVPLGDGKDAEAAREVNI